MDYEGIIIAESLADASPLWRLRITATRIEAVTAEHHTPGIKQWTLHTVTIPERDAPNVADELSAVLAPDHWYADFKNETTHFIIFPDKVFTVDRRDVRQYQEAVAYGMQHGIPEYQLDFSPTVKPWSRPEDQAESEASE